MPEITAKSIVDGWLHTGDVAMRDEDGYYYIVDRVKDMYISGGENVYPAEVENVIYQLPQVAETAVIGVPDEKWGEVGRALVALKAGPDTDRGGDHRALPRQPGAATRCRARSSSCRRCRAIPPGKVVKGELRALYGK